MIKDLNDIERERQEADSIKLKEQIVRDSSEIFSKVTKKIKEDKIKNRPVKNKILRFIIYTLFSIATLLFFINLILLNLWVLKWVIKSLFG